MSSNEMYGRVDWMVAADEAILRLLGTPKQIELNTSNIAWNTGYTGQYLRERLKILVEAGLVTRIEEEGSHPHFTTSDLGERYVKDELSVQQLERLGPEN